MKNSPAVLMYGTDVRLLQTRGWLLEASGYRALTAMDLPQLEWMAMREPVEVLILCHSLSAVAMERALAWVKERMPHMHTLVMAAGNGPLAGARPDAVLEPLAGPAKLLSMVGELAGHQMTAHRPVPAAEVLGLAG
ncbi:MAG TPA: hypothetical protein VM865_09215 [Acidobacteriaceae bacterium]|nr:hypothetical protein [Acidobacteriaceae bacterium]